MHMVARANNIKEHGGGARLLDVSPFEFVGDVLSKFDDLLRSYSDFNSLSNSGLVVIFSLFRMEGWCQCEMCGGCDCDGRGEARGVSESTSNCAFRNSRWFAEEIDRLSGTVRTRPRRCD
jgi:hypothetical protein